MSEGSEFASSKNKLYRENYLKNKRRREIVFSAGEYAFIEGRARLYRRPMGEFLKQCIFSHLREKYLLHDEALFQGLLLEIRRIGTNINQITRKVNSAGVITLVDSLKLSKQLKGMELLLKNTIANPPKLLTALEESFSDPWFMYQVELLIYNVKLQQNDCKNSHVESAKFQKTNQLYPQG